ncbi:MAG: hypothetical protein WD181_01750 [Solirubrobacterales bacterium]
MIGRQIPTALLPAAGFAALTAAGGLITCFPAIAEITTAVSVALAVAGFVLSWPPGGREFSWWPVLAAAGVFFVFGAPVILSGEATFTGYIKLDDTATWLAFADHVLTYGHSVAGLAPSTYEALVQINLSAGYPVGTFIPLAVGGELTGTDPAWLFQPYLAVMAAMMTLVFFEIARPVISSVKVRSAVVFVAAQPALLVGFAYWGGIKEVATALLVATLAASAAWLARPDSGQTLRSVVPVPIVAGAALIGVMGIGGAPWILAVGAGVLVLMGVEIIAARRASNSVEGGVAGLIRSFARRGVVVAVGIALIGLPTVFAAGQFFSPDQDGLTSGQEMGNLIRDLSLAQYVGPWLSGDFRLEPGSMWPTVILIVAGLVAFVFGAWAAWVRRAWGLLLVAGGTGLGSLIVWLLGSPWVQGKALATGTASFLIVAVVGIAALIFYPSIFFGKDQGKPDLARNLKAIGAVLLIVPAGVIVSNVLAYDEAWLAPRGQLVELEKIGEEFAGQGPALMTEYQPYGVRHFLRYLDAEGASELRRRLIPKLDGTEAEKGAWVDTDQLQLDPAQEGLLTYRTLVLRRSPLQSRPPYPYELVQSGDYYDVWQRPESFEPGSLAEHRPFGSPTDPGAVPSCAAIGALASKAGPGGSVAAAPAPLIATAAFTDFPPDWVPDPAGGTVTPLSDGTAQAEATLPESGRWQVWLGGSARGEISVKVNGSDAGSVSSRLNNNAQFIELDQLDLQAGALQIEVTYSQEGLPRPATGSYPFGFGPVVFSRVGSENAVLTLAPSDFRQLCGRRFDWIAALR